MFIDNTTPEDIDFVIDNLCEKVIEELKVMFGDDYKFLLSEQLYNLQLEDIRTVRLKKNNEPVAIFGLIPLNEYPSINIIAGIFFLSTENLYQGNMITFLKGTKKVVDCWAKQYQLLLDKCYKRYSSVVKWLKFLGFEPHPESKGKDFQIYFKGDSTLINIGSYDE